MIIIKTVSLTSVLLKDDSLLVKIKSIMGFSNESVEFYYVR